MDGKTDELPISRLDLGHIYGKRTGWLVVGLVGDGMFQRHNIGVTQIPRGSPDLVPKRRMQKNTTA